MARQFGSAFLLKIRTTTLVLTAAHVYYRRHELPLYLPGAVHPEPIEGTAIFTGPREKIDHPDFGLDVAIVVLTPAAASRCSGTTALSIDDLDVNDQPAKQVQYGFVGYPGSENQPRSDFKILQTSYYYGGQPAASLEYDLLGVRPQTHFVMTFDDQAMVDRRGNVTQVPAPNGMSGGPVFRLGSFSEIDQQLAQPKVIALTVEWWKSRSVLSGVRIGIAVEMLRNYFPELVRDIPRSRYLGVNIDGSSK